MATTCPACGAANDPEDRFCGDCGSAIGGDPGSTGGAHVGAAGGPGGAPALRAASPGAGSAVAGSAGATERRLVSVLFADLVGFTTLADDSDPEAVREFLGRYFDVAREVVERYGGAVEKFIGDAVMAVWGTPTAREDDAERAVRAALDLVAAVPGLAAPGGDHPQARAAVLTGEAAAVVGAQGQGMVAGDLVNTASRLQAAAPPGTVLVGEATLRAAGESIVFEAAGEQLLRGKSAPVPAWRAVRVVAGRRGAGRSSRVEPPFVGRDEELQLLKDLLHATTRDGRARLASVVGMAGIGKSRLAWELEKYVDGVAADIYWHRGRSPAYGEGLAFWALGEMVRERAGIAESDDAATSRAKLAASLREYVADAAERAWMEPRLAALLGLEAAPAGEREEFEAACRTLFERISERGTVVLVFEELQWADPALLDFIETITDRSRARPILVLTLSRPDLLERRPTWGAGLRSFSNLLLDPLAPDEVEMLLVGLAPGLPATAIAAIVERAGGDPALCGRDGPDAAGPGRPARARRPLPPRRRAGAAGHPRDAGRAPGVATRRADGARADADRPRGGAGPLLHRRRARGGDGALRRSTWGRRSTRSSARRSSTSTRIRVRRSGASTTSSRGSSARSPTSGWPSATGWPATWPRRATSRSSTTRSWPGSSRRTTWRPTGSRRRARSATRSRRRRGRRSSKRPRARGTCTPTRASSASSSRRSRSQPIRPTSGRSWPGSPARRSTARRSWPSSTGPRASRAARSRRRSPAATRPQPPASYTTLASILASNNHAQGGPRHPAPGGRRARRAGRRMPRWCAWRPSSGAPT